MLGFQGLRDVMRDYGQLPSRALDCGSPCLRDDLSLVLQGSGSKGRLVFGGGGGDDHLHLNTDRPL